LPKINIQQLFAQSQALRWNCRRLLPILKKTIRIRLLKGLVGSSLSFVLAMLFKAADKPFLIIFYDKEGSCLPFKTIWKQLVGEKEVLFLSWEVTADHIN